jgi:glyoxylase-like metal-dependent hydrolase (beta-lactamase superfamily II)
LQAQKNSFINRFFWGVLWVRLPMADDLMERRHRRTDNKEFKILMEKTGIVKEICSELFCIKVPLPDSPLKYLNSYIVRSPDRSLIVDTGFNHKQCFDTLTSGLNFLGIDLAQTDIFVTHFHADHFSLVPKLKTPTTRVYFNRLETELLENWQGFGPMLKNADRQGFPKGKLKAALEAHPGSRFGVEWAPEANILAQGHTLGHICLYEKAKKILISGDHVLIDISPNIQCWNDHENPLKNYLHSLEKVGKLEVVSVLPGHRRGFTDLKSRVDELTRHHENRLDEICSILDKTPQSAYETAARMSWDIKAACWEDFPIAQQWFATGEALSHLRYLEENGTISRNLSGDNIRFALAKDPI